VSDYLSNEKRSKYLNIKATRNGQVYDSKAEAARYTELRLLEMAGEISDLERQPKYTVLDGFRDGFGKWHRVVTWTPDYRYFDKQAGHWVVEDVKGGDGRWSTKTTDWSLRTKLFRLRYPDIEVRVVEKGG